eukprot:717142-Hanusia_phi.AAC.5
MADRNHTEKREDEDGDEDEDAGGREGGREGEGGEMEARRKAGEDTGDEEAKKAINILFDAQESSW